jgi:very-short-patch-repair endonuclease
MPTNISPTTRNIARRLRRAMTPVEGNLWSKLKTLRHSHGLHFRRQVPIGRFIVDFACLRRRLVIEVDGSSHDGAAAAVRDAEREALLCAQGFRVVRVSNADVMSDGLSVIDTIIREAEI